MKTPKVVLKNVKFFEGHDTMQGMSADIWINGTKCMHVYDSAHGGCYEYTNHNYDDKTKSLIKHLEDYIATLPEREYEFGGRKHSIKIDMDGFLEDIIQEIEQKKVDKKRLKLQKQAILFGFDVKSNYSYLKFKRPLSEIPQLLMQQELNKIVKKHCTNGEIILNTNLKELGVTI